MNKTIAILIFTFFLGCNALTQAAQSVPPPDTVAPVVTITQQQFDSLVAAAARGNQMELIAKQEAERMFDIYTTHVSWVIGLFGVLVALFGAALPYLINRNYEKRIEKKIAGHDEEIKQSRQSLSDQSRKNEQLMSELEGVKGHVDNVESSIKEMQEQVKQSEARTRESSKEAKAWALFSWARQIQVGTHDKRELDKAINIYSQAITEFPQFPEALINRGNAYLKQGEYGKAIQDYGEAIKLRPQDAIAYNNRGFAYMRRGKEGDYALAKADFEKDLTLDPDEETRQRLQKNLRDVEDKMNGKTDSAPTQ